MKALRLSVFGIALSATAGAFAQSAVSFPSLATERPDSLSALVYTPEGAGPFPAVVLAHGCGGIGRNVHNWAAFLQKRGYVALVLDSFSSRSISEICTTPRLTLADRVGDAYGALKYLQSLPNVDGGRVGMMGFSHGAMTTLKAISESTAFPLGAAPRFAAAIALYPDCLTSEVDATVPLLIQSAARDDWTLAAPCQAKGATRKAEGYPVEVEVIPNAMHGFDIPEVPNHYYGANWRNMNKPKFCCGASIGYNAAATNKAEQAAETFFVRHLGAAEPASGRAWTPKRAPTREDLVALVQAAKAYAAANGKDKLIEAINSLDERFRKRRLFLGLVDKQGISLASGLLPVAMTGFDTSGAKDLDGRPVFGELQAALERNPSWESMRGVFADTDIYVERLGEDLLLGYLIK